MRHLALVMGTAAVVVAVWVLLSKDHGLTATPLPEVREEPPPSTGRVRADRAASRAPRRGTGPGRPGTLIKASWYKKDTLPYQLTRSSVLAGVRCI